MPDFERFKRIAMVLGDCPINDKGEPVEAAGWISRFADVMEMDRGNMSKLFSGRRKLSDTLEDRLVAKAANWQNEQVKRLQAVLRGTAEIKADRQAQQIAASLENENGPEPQI